MSPTHERSSAYTSAAQASSRCSQLSSTSTTSRSRSALINSSGTSRAPSVRTSSAAATAAGDQLGIANRGQLDEPHLVAGAADDLLRDPQREARLAAAARTRQGDEPLLARSSARDFARLGLAAHEARELRGQVVARPLDRPKRASDVLQAVGTHVEHLLGPAEILQPMLTQVAEPDA